MNQPLPVSALANTAEIFLGRQPILDHKKQIIAFAKKLWNVMNKVR